MLTVDRATIKNKIEDGREAPKNPSNLYNKTRHYIYFHCPSASFKYYNNNLNRTLNSHLNSSN